MQHFARSGTILFVSLLVVVLASGCVDQIPGLNLNFGSDVITPSRSELTTGTSDVVAIEDVRAWPSSLLPEQSVKLFMNIVSKDTDPLKPIRNVRIELYDASVFKNPQGQFCNQVYTSCAPDQCGSSFDCTLQASDKKQIIFDLVAPSSSDIANIITKATMSWLVRYNYESKTTFDFLMVSEQEILRLQQLGETLSIPVQTVQSAGPIKIDVATPTAFGMISQSGRSPDVFLIFKLRNAGSGFLQENNIPVDALSVQFPQNIGTVTSDQFSCAGTTCTNNQKILFLRKETIPLQFRISPNAATLPTGVPHRTFTITATVPYRYELRGSMTLEITPPRVGG